MSRTESSAERTEVKEVRAATRVDSGAWKAGEREGMMVGVRTRTEGLGVVGGGPGLRYGWERGRDVRRGRKVWRVRMGVRTRVLRRSLRVEGERVAIGEEG
jgi:hypothetical protein